jgi:myo-inositol-1(or 4)-monophosphatase
MAINTPLMNVMTAAARKAAKVLIRDFGEVEHLQASKKGPADFVTQTDLRVERALRDELSRTRPHYGFVMEEGGVVEGLDKTHRWFIDPIDGTTNFIHSIPHFAISIGLEREGHLVAGLVFNPIRDEMFTAEKGQGAWLNDRRLRVSSRRELSTAVVATGIPFLGREGHDEFLTELPKVMNEVAGVRRFGAASLDLAFVAAGRFDAFWERGLSSWDLAAGTVIVREAGGQVTDLTGGDNFLDGRQILASNTELHPALLKCLGGSAA